MKRLLALALLLLPAVALAQTQGQIDADIDSFLASDKTPPIPAADMRTVLHEMNTTAYGNVSSVAVGCGGFSTGGAITSVGEIDTSVPSIAHVTGDTISVSECGRLATFSSSSAVAITLPQANAAGQFVAGWFEDFTNYGSGTVTFTTTTSNFLNNGTHVATLAGGQSFRLVSSTATPGSYDVTSTGNNGTVTSVAVGCAGFSTGGAITIVGEIDASLASIAHVTTDTIGNSECGRLGTFNSGSAVAITLPRANFSGLFLPGWFEEFTNYGAGLVTFTTTTSTFLSNGTSTITLAAGQSFKLISSTATPGSWDVTGIGTAAAGGVTTISNSDGTLTISPTSGAAVASLALSHANTWTGAQTFGPVIGSVSTQSGTTYTFAATDCGTTVRFTSNSAVTATIPTTLAAGCHIEVVQRGTAKVSVNGTAVSACTLTSGHAYTGTAGTAGSVVLVLMDAANTCILTGDGS